MNQYQIEQALKLTEEETEWLNLPGFLVGDVLAIRDSVVSFLGIQCRSYDPAGFAMLEAAVATMRQYRSDWELVAAYLNYNAPLRNFFTPIQQEGIRRHSDSTCHGSMWEWEIIKTSSVASIHKMADEIRKLLHMEATGGKGL